MIGSSKPAYITSLSCEFIQLPRFTNDEERHDFVLDSLQPVPFDSLIILIDAENGYDALQIGLHIRLTIELYKKRLVPIVFVSSDSLAVILRQKSVLGRLLVTEGCSLEQPDVKAIQKSINYLPGLPVDELNQFLDTIQLQPEPDAKEGGGRHSLANQWGAYILDKVAGTRALKNNSFITKAQKQLYFKYISAKNYDNDKLTKPLVTLIDLPKKMERVTAQDKKIMLIDDEADKGWEETLRVLFKTTNPNVDFKVINRKISKWDDLDPDEKDTILAGDIDLFLIDLRLSGNDEETTAKPDAFSGTDILRHIKKDNEGSQIVMFTASNKAWNLKALLDYGADGYYIKESPEYGFPLSFSEENFKNFQKESLRCLESSFLRRLDESHQRCIKFLDEQISLRTISVRNLYGRAKASLKVAFELAKRISTDEQYRNLTFLTYYQILEDYASESENFRFVSLKECYVNNRSIRVIDDSNGSLKWSLTLVEDPSGWKYFMKGDETKTDVSYPQSLAKISFLLTYKFFKDDNVLKDWGRLNNLRNKKAGHGGSQGVVSLNELFEILNLVELFLTNP